MLGLAEGAQAMLILYALDEWQNTAWPRLVLVTEGTSGTLLLSCDGFQAEIAGFTSIDWQPCTCMQRQTRYVHIPWVFVEICVALFSSTRDSPKSAICMHKYTVSRKCLLLSTEHMCHTFKLPYQADLHQQLHQDSAELMEAGQKLGCNSA